MSATGDNEKLRDALFRASQYIERLEANEADIAATGDRVARNAVESEALHQEIKRLVASNRQMMADWKQMRDDIKDRLYGDDGESWKDR